MLQFTIKHKWFSSIAINLLLFFAVNIFLFPIFNSGDDVFLMYSLSGGFGDPPTNLLHYDYGWHPALGWLVRSMYEKFPDINWYGFLLILLQLKACSIFLYLLFKKFSAGNALLLFLIFFCFIEIRILLSLNFTSTAWITAAAGFVLLLDGTRQKRNTFYIISGFVLMMIAGMLRLHVLVAVGILLIPALVIYTKKEFKTWTAVIVLVAGILFLLNFQHKNYYKKNIPGWEHQEAYRQTLFKLSNNAENAAALNQIVFTDTTVLAFYKAKFFIDTGFISQNKLDQLSRFLKKESNFSIKNFSSGLYWMFIELRVYLLLLGFCLFILWSTGWLKVFLSRWILPFLIVAGAYFFLSVFLKINFSLQMGFMLVLWIYSIQVLAACKVIIPVSKIRYGFFILLLIPFVWMGVRIYKTDADNRIKHQQFECLVSELQKYSDKLFIATDDLLPLPFYFVWDNPSKNRITNLIYKDRVTTFSYQSTSQKFGVSDIMQDILTNSNIRLLGNDLPGLKKYYRIKYGAEIDIIKDDIKFSCLNVAYCLCKSGCEELSK